MPCRSIGKPRKLHRNVRFSSPLSSALPELIPLPVSRQDCRHRAWLSCLVGLCIRQGSTEVSRDRDEAPPAHERTFTNEQPRTTSRFGWSHVVTPTLLRQLT